MTLIAASVGAMILFTFGIEVALRPSLGPHEVPERRLVSYVSARMASNEAHAACCGCAGGDEAPYNVNRALLSEESMDPEGTGPARRRYVRPGSNAIGTTTTLVTDVTDVTARRRRRNPAL